MGKRGSPVSLANMRETGTMCFHVLQHDWLGKKVTGWGRKDKVLGYTFPIFFTPSRFGLYTILETSL
jgi:hypothetical protein